jgi:hypothetical protein
MIDRCCCGCGGCGGCSGEMYWSEWHNDPPCCHDPCDCYGNWLGSGCGGRCCYGDNGFCEPYEHAYCPTCNNGQGGGYYANRGQMGPMYAGRPGMTGRGVPYSQVARGPMTRSAVRPPMARSTAPAPVARTAAPVSANRAAAAPNPWRGAQRPTTNARPVATTENMTRGQLTRKPAPPAYNTFQR